MRWSIDWQFSKRESGGFSGEMWGGDIEATINAAIFFLKAEVGIHGKIKDEYSLGIFDEVESDIQWSLKFAQHFKALDI